MVATILLLLAAPAAATHLAVAAEGPGVEKDRKVLVHFPGGPRAYLGVGLTQLTPELRTHFGAPEDRGVLIASLDEEAPAAAAGVRVGDLLLAIDDRPVTTRREVMAALRGKEEGEAVTLELVRDRRLHQLTVHVVERERTSHRFPPGLRERAGKRMLVLEGDALDPEEIRAEVEKHMVEVRRHFDSPEFRGRIREMRSERRQLVEERMRELEQRIEELERELERSRRPPRD